MLGWLQTAVSAVWYAFTNEKGNSFFNWIGRNWLLIAGILCIIGAAADLCVYILRWKPFRVWKSFLFRNRETNAENHIGNAYPKQAGRADCRDGKLYAEQIDELHYGNVNKAKDEPDLSPWIAGKEEIPQETAQSPEEPAMVTGAGYVVPADSPYRRPDKRKAENTSGYQEKGTRINTEAKTETDQTPTVMPRRRRRINVGELFSDPEEELREFDAPQHIIDSKKAYLDPVYPRGWKKSEDNGE